MASVEAHKLLRNPKVKAYIESRMKELEDIAIAKQDEVLKILTKILRQELTEEVTEVNPLTGEFIRIEKRPGISEVIKAGSEILRRYPINNSLIIRKLEAETKIIEHEANLLEFDKDKQQNIMDLISIGKQVFGGDIE